MPSGTLNEVGNPGRHRVRHMTFDGEFDPGSGRTLAVCFTHASRTVNHLRVGISGERVSNTWATCPEHWDNSGKPLLIPDTTTDRMVWSWKGFRLGMGPRPIS